MLFSCKETKQDTNDAEQNPFGIVPNAKSQILHPCHWSFAVEPNGEDEIILISTAKLDSGWHLYSQYTSDKVATKFTYDSLQTYKLIAVTDEGETINKYDPYLETEVRYFEREAVFKQ